MCIQKSPVNAFKFQQYGFGEVWKEGSPNAEQHLAEKKPAES